MKSSGDEKSLKVGGEALKSGGKVIQVNGDVLKGDREALNDNGEALNLIEGQRRDAKRRFSGAKGRREGVRLQ